MSKELIQRSPRLNQEIYDPSSGPVHNFIEEEPAVAPDATAEPTPPVVEPNQEEVSPTEQQQQEAQKPVPPVEPAKVVIDPESMQALAQTVQKAQKPAEPEKTELTPEEKQKLFQPFNIETRQIETLLDGDTPVEDKKNVLTEMLQAVVRNAVAMGEVAAYRRYGSYQDQISALEQTIQAQQAEQAVETFYGKYPGLKPYEQLVQVVANNVQPTDATGKAKTNEQLMSEVKDGVVGMLGKSGVDTKNLETSLATPKAGVTQKTTPSMAPMSPPSRSSVSPNTQTPDDDSPAAEQARMAKYRRGY